MFQPYYFHEAAQPVHLSTDDGATWSELDEAPHLTQLVIGPSGYTFASTADGLLLRSQDFRTWDALPIADHILAVSVEEDGTVWAGGETRTEEAEGRLHLSEDDGASWRAVPPPPSPPVSTGTPVSRIVSTPFGTFVHRSSDLYLTKDRGTTWHHVRIAGTFALLPRLVGEYAYVEVGPYGELYRSRDGVNWAEVSTEGFRLSDIARGLAAYDRHLFGWNGSRLYVLGPEPDTTWTPISTSWTSLEPAVSLHPNLLFATTGHLMMYGNHNGDYHLYRTADPVISYQSGSSGGENPYSSFSNRMR